MHVYIKREIYCLHYELYRSSELEITITCQVGLPTTQNLYVYRLSTFENKVHVPVLIIILLCDLAHHQQFSTFHHADTPY